MFTKKAFVLFSGGLDSTTVLYLAVKRFGAQNVTAVSCDYGQRHIKEIEYAQRTCQRLGCEQVRLSLGSLLSGGGVMLTDPSVKVPDIAYSDIQGVSPTYVPFRNGTMLAAITALAQKEVMRQIEAGMLDDIRSEHSTPMQMKQVLTDEARDLVTIYAGQHAEDAANWAYPDCTFEFLGSMANAIYLGTYFTVRLNTPFVNATKDEIVRVGDELGVHYEDSWSCYRGEALHCGTCPTCRSRKDAFDKAGVLDPTVYQDIVDVANQMSADDEIPF